MCGASYHPEFTWDISIKVTLIYRHNLIGGTILRYLVCLVLNEKNTPVIITSRFFIVLWTGASQTGFLTEPAKPRIQQQAGYQ